MAQRKLNQARVDEIRAAYEEWSQWGSHETSVELAQRLDISKARLYSLKAKGWKLASSRSALATLEAESERDSDDSRMINVLAEKLMEAGGRIMLLEAENKRVLAENARLRGDPGSI